MRHKCSKEWEEFLRILIFECLFAVDKMGSGSRCTMVIIIQAVIVFETERLMVRKATVDDAAHFYALWTNPQVMGYVGFPQGLKVTRRQIENMIREQGDGVFNGRLLVLLKATGEKIGEAALHLPNEYGIAETDVKLLPQFWGNKYGVEVKQGLVDYLFTHTTCKIVQASPNVNNAASINMQEAVGAVCVGEKIHEFPAHMRGYTQDVHAYIYHVRREDWEKKQ
jgi:RimJ/RimL family protein N-acetyltransferase